MNTANSNNAINPVDMITKLAETQITEAIVTAAKSKKTVEKTFSEEILENLAAGRYAEEAAINLTRIFGRAFDPIADQILEFAKRLTPSDTTVAPAKKPRAKKASKTVVAPTATTVDNMVNEEVTATANETKKTKKPRAKKVPVEPVVEPTNSNDVTVPVEEVASGEPLEKPVTAAPAKKPRAKKTVSDDTTNDKKEETVEIASASSVTVSEEHLAAAVAAAPAKKPRAKKTVSIETTAEKKEETNEVGSDDSSVNAVSEKPVKKPRTKKVTVVAPAATTDAVPPVAFEPIAEVQNEVPVPVSVEEVITSSAENNEIILTDEDFDAELSGFSEGWTDELIEEELSDIEYDDE